MATARESTTRPSLPWHAKRAADVLLHLDADGERGLTAEDARRRLARVGPNRIADQPDTPLWRLALDQFKSLVVVLLLPPPGSHSSSVSASRQWRFSSPFS